MKDSKAFARWPTLLAGLTLATAGIGLDLAKQAPVAYGLWALASACFGSFLYAEGARHREWWGAEETPQSGDKTTDSETQEDQA